MRIGCDVGQQVPPYGDFYLGDGENKWDKALVVRSILELSNHIIIVYSNTPLQSFCVNSLPADHIIIVPSNTPI